MKKKLVFVSLLCVAITCPSYAGNGKFWKAVKGIAKDLFVAASTAAVEQTLEHSGYSQDDSKEMTFKLLSDLGVNNENVTRGLDFISASDKFQKEKVIADYAFDKVMDGSESDIELLGYLKSMNSANLQYLSDKSQSQTDEERVIAFAKKVQNYNEIFYDSYQYGNERRKEYLSEKLKIEEKLLSEGWTDNPNLAMEVASSILAVQQSTTMTYEEKLDYYKRFGIFQNEQEVFQSAQECLDNDYSNMTTEQQYEDQTVPEPVQIDNIQSKIKAAVEALSSVCLTTFPFNGYELSESQKMELKVVANILENMPTLPIQIIGHTCNIGSEQENLTVGLRRANSAKAFLVQNGIDENQIITLSEGESNPRFANDTEESRSKNRRIEISIIQ